VTLNDFRTTLTEKSLGRNSLPEDAQLKERIFSGLKMIAKETIPLKLIVSEPSGFDILRRIDDTTYVRMPRRPTEEDIDLDIEDDLIDALGYLVMAGLERANKKEHTGRNLRERDMNNDRLIETTLSDTTNQGYWQEVYV